MQTGAETILQQLAAISLEKCLVRLSRVSEGTWRMLDINILNGTLESAAAVDGPSSQAAAVHFTLPVGADLTAVMLFNREDIGCVSQAFTGLSFPKSERVTPAQEVMLLELGNIVLNALASAVLNILHKFAMPAVPQFAEGETAGLLRRMAPAAGPADRVIMGKLAIKSGDCETVASILALIPGGLAREIENAAAEGRITP